MSFDSRRFGGGDAATELDAAQTHELQMICALFARSGWAPVAHHHLTFLGLTIDVEDIARRIGKLTTPDDFIANAPYLMSADTILKEFGTRQEGAFVGLVPEHMRHRGGGTITTLLRLWHKRYSDNAGISALANITT